MTAPIAATRRGTSRRMPAADRRSRTVVFRCTETEGDLIERAAEALGCSLSDLLRDAAILHARQQISA
jgi:uncharacterized protein (DUF1778 family)